ncbi:MAG TPA: ComF family protein [Clostridiales bacterium]|nr:ComF family protein [Clostridiales bacterium]
MIKSVKILISYIGDLLFPPSCMLCGEYLGDSIYVCHDCLKDLPLNRNESKDHISVFDYGNGLRLMIHELKYNQRPEIGIILGKEAGRRLAGIIDPSHSVLVPVPLHKKRLRKRGYNQADLICEGLASELSVPVNRYLLKRVKNNISQTTLNAEGRSANVKGIFDIFKTDTERSKLILLVDDVITTGSTTKEAGAVLKNAGYLNYFALSIATVK